MFRLIAWYEDIDPAGALTPITALQDQSVTINGDNIVVPNDTPNLIGGAAIIGDASGVQVQLQSPSLRQKTYPNIAPFSVTADVFGNPIPHTWHGATPTALQAQEDLRAYVESNPPAAEAHYVCAWLSDGPIQPVNGPMQTVRCTATVQSAVATWTAGQLSFDQELPVGKYQVVGFRAEDTGLVFARLIFPAQVARPGIAAPNGVANVDAPWARFGRSGVWGEFHTTNPPQIEVIGGTAATQVVYLDLIRIGN